MTPENFVYWLQGYLEISDDHEDGFSEAQIEKIKAHIGLVLENATQDRERAAKQTVMDFTDPRTTLLC